MYCHFRKIARRGSRRDEQLSPGTPLTRTEPLSRRPRPKFVLERGGGRKCDSIQSALSPGTTKRSFPDFTPIVGLENFSGSKFDGREPAPAADIRVDDLQEAQVQWLSAGLWRVTGDDDLAQEMGPHLFWLDVFPLEYRVRLFGHRSVRVVGGMHENELLRLVTEDALAFVQARFDRATGRLDLSRSYCLDAPNRQRRKAGSTQGSGEQSLVGSPESIYLGFSLTISVLRCSIVIDTEGRTPVGHSGESEPMNFVTKTTR